MDTKILAASALLTLAGAAHGQDGATTYGVLDTALENERFDRSHSTRQTHGVGLRAERFGAVGGVWRHASSTTAQEGWRGEARQDTARRGDARSAGIALHYASGPLWLGYGHNRLSARIPADLGDADQRTNTVGAKFDFGVAKVGATMSRTRITETFGGTPARTGAVAAWHLSGMVPFGNGQFSLGIGRLRENSGKGVAGYQIGYVQTLSRQTQMFTYLSRIKNSASGVGGLALDNGGFSHVAPGYGPVSLMVGIRHQF